MKAVEITPEILNRTFKKRLLALLLTGLILIAADHLAAAMDNEVKMIKSGGKIYLIRPAENQEAGHLSLKARIEGGGKTREKNYRITIDPYSKGGDVPDSAASRNENAGSPSPEELAEYEMRSAVSGLNDDISVRKIALPSSLSSGEKIYWSTSTNSNAVLIVFAMTIACFLLCQNRLAPIKKRRQEERDSIERQLPEFVNKLVLLLNAGLVLDTAFKRSVEESPGFGEGTGDYFHTKMKDIYMSLGQTNASLGREFKAFARSSGTNELMRISNIISDNISKGVELTEKLQLENELLWSNRKRSCEERGRISETRLTLPLTLFLLVLIAITAGPALLEL